MIVVDSFFRVSVPDSLSLKSRFGQAFRDSSKIICRTSSLRIFDQTGTNRVEYLDLL